VDLFGIIKTKWRDQKIKTLSDEVDQILKSLFSVDELLTTPSSFFDEPYVQGFFTGYTMAVQDIRFDALSWTKSERGEFQILLYRNINNGETYGLQRMLKDLDFTRSLTNNAEFINARDEGSTVAVVCHNKLKQDANEPLIESAKKTANQIGVDLPTAILMDTIGSFKLRWTEKS
jgi:hypothetical protein